MDIVLNVVLLGWFLIACIMVYAAFLSERELWGKGSTIFASLLFVFLLIFILNNYIGNEVIEGTVYAVSKISADKTVRVELSTSLKTEIQPSRDILKAYEVAIYPTGSKKLSILKNNNNLWRLKFNKREIQLQIEAGKRYKFRVHRLFLRRNIIEIQGE